MRPNGTEHSRRGKWTGTGINKSRRRERLRAHGKRQWLRDWFIALALILTGCSALQSQPAQTAVDTAVGLCDAPLVTLLKDSPALQAEAERLGLPGVGALVDLVCASAELVDAAQQSRAVDPGAAAVERLQGYGL
jgi:hypothetical protein